MPAGKIYIAAKGRKGGMNPPKRKYIFKRISWRKRQGLRNLSLQILPKVKYVRHRYAESTQLFINNSFSDQIVYSLNGLYDPHISGGSGAGVNHQPYLFDQMNALYNTYCVLGAKITIHLRPGSNGNTYAMNVYGETSELTSVQYPGSIALEKPGVKVARFAASSTNVYTPARKMTFWWSAKKGFRAKDRTELISNEDYNGNGSNNPLVQQFLYLTMQAHALQQTTAVLAADVIIDYIVAWTEPKQVNQS